MLRVHEICMMHVHVHEHMHGSELGFWNPKSHQKIRKGEQKEKETNCVIQGSR